jgi:rhamnosyltransferase
LTEQPPIREDEITLSVIIPTLNASDRLGCLITSLREQSLKPLEISVIDSTSDDDTVAIAGAAGCGVQVIDRHQFSHGRARNMAAETACGNVLVFLSQDAIPKDNAFLDEISRPIREGMAVAVTARQIPYPGANPLEVYSRMANYPAVSHLRDLGAVDSMGVMAYFFSNAASAVRKDVIRAIGGFPEDLVVNEDMKLCAELLHAGYTVAYQAEAEVYHSHNFSIGEKFGRFFDIGVFFDQAGDPIESQSPIGRGRSFAFEQIRYLVRTGKWLWVPASAAESLIKLIAFELGKRSRVFPAWIKRILSRQKYYWD